MQLTEIDTDGNGVIDEGEWLVYIKAQSVANSAATKKLLRAFVAPLAAAQAYPNPNPNPNPN